MDLMDLLYWAIVGGVAGWLAGLLFKGRGFGFFGNIVVGIVGAIIGGFVFGQLGIQFGSGLLATIINAVLGAAILLFIIGLLKKA